jgi:hypothetical protein
MVELNVKDREESSKPYFDFGRLDKIIEWTPLSVISILNWIPHKWNPLPKREQEKLFSILDNLEYLRLDYDITEEVLKKHLKERLKLL